MVTLHDAKRLLERRAQDWKNATVDSQFHKESSRFLVWLTIDPGFPFDYRILYVSEKEDGSLLSCVCEEATGDFLHDIVEIEDIEDFEPLFARLRRGVSTPGVDGEMAIDRFVRFEKGKAPSLKDVQLALEDFLGAVGTVEAVGNDLLMAKLVGEGTFPFKRLGETDLLSNRSGQRCFTIQTGRRAIDVITRQQDELTNVLADGFAKLVARYWNGKYDPDECG